MVQAQQIPLHHHKRTHPIVIAAGRTVADTRDTAAGTTFPAHTNLRRPQHHYMGAVYQISPALVITASLAMNVGHLHLASAGTKKTTAWLQPWNYYLAALGARAHQEVFL